MDTATLPAPDTAPRTTPAGTHAGTHAGTAPARPGEAERPPGGSAAGRARRLVRGPEGDPPWARPALLALLAATAGAYLWNLTSSGWANAFYSAAVQAGADSWSAFLWGSFDAGNAITVDKPPAALWVMALSVRLLGLSSFAILLPQVLMGVGTVAVVHATVKRRFGAGAGLVAGAALALTPVAVLMFRFNNPDALLTLLMALAAWATLQAVDRGSIRWMALAGVFVGLGFLTKSLQVLLVVPALGIAWMLLADTTVRRRLLGALAAVGATVASAGWWVALVELVPASMRPYVGGSQADSFLELTFGYNGLGRLDGTEVGRVGDGGGGGGFSAGVGLFRMLDSSVGGQVSWLLPAALFLLVGGIAFRGRAARTDSRRAAYVVMGGWMLVTTLTFSLMQGIFHEYYTVALAPAIAAVVGMGAAEAWARRDRFTGSVVLAVATLLGAGWGFLLLSRTTEYGSWLRLVVLATGVASALLLLLAGRLHTAAVRAAAVAAVVAALAGPAAYSATTLASAHSGSIVTAGPSTGSGPFGDGMRGGFGGGMPPGATTATRQGGMGGLLDATTPDAEVVSALTADAASYRWVAAAVGSQNAAGLQLATEEPVMAIGGFNGSDPAPTLAQFQQYVADGDIHWFLAGGGFRGQNGGSSASSEIATWVAATFTEVTIGGQSFYDLTQPLTGSAS
ncbi:glycosyltransferase family 39 protein [Oryzobacter sp. R7]|uniref:glycosyltransferase family 39 protein n=1 Tax=Oryzobacter faecalis TaxID=3388656 RepID=UPI00398CDC28